MDPAKDTTRELPMGGGERESKGGEGYKEESPSLYQKKEKREKKGNKEDRFMEKSS